MESSDKTQLDLVEDLVESDSYGDGLGQLQHFVSWWNVIFEKKN